jgi:hypothetical protein
MATLGVLAFWGGLWMAEDRYPSEYDWRYMTISSLLYPERNPHGYLWAWGGTVLCGLGGLCWSAVSFRNRAGGGPESRPKGIWALGLGYTCMVCCALWPGRLLHFPRGHDLLALSAFLGICVGTVQLTFQTVVQRMRLRARSCCVRPRAVACLLAGVALLPMGLAVIAQTYVSHALPNLPWVGLEWRTRGVPVYLSFAFWEWGTCVIFSAYTTSLSLLWCY